MCKQSCGFTGHRPAKLPWGENESDGRALALKLRLAAALESAYAEGMRHFICGMAQGCDLYFCEAVLALRRIHPDVELEAAVPCPEQADGWAPEQRRRYRSLLEACDCKTLIQPSYSPDCMKKRNRFIVDHSAMLLAVYDGVTPGGTLQTLSYALRAGHRVVQLDPSDS